MSEHVKKGNHLAKSYTNDNPVEQDNELKCKFEGRFCFQRFDENSVFSHGNTSEVLYNDKCMVNQGEEI